MNQHHQTGCQCKTCREVSLGVFPAKYPEGAHMCLIYRDEAQRQKIIAKYLETGLLENERVGYFADEMTPSEVMKWLEQDMGVEIPKGRRQNLDVLRAADVYCPGKQFDPEKMLGKLRAFYDEAKAKGLPGARVSGEMGWALREEVEGTERLLEYEAKVNEVLITHPVTAICQYNASLFDGVTITDLILVHPYMIVHGQVVKNLAYMKPEEFFALRGK